MHGTVQKKKGDEGGKKIEKTQVTMSTCLEERGESVEGKEKPLVMKTI